MVSVISATTVMASLRKLVSTAHVAMVDAPRKAGSRPAARHVGVVRA
jgi:hypothetical protein